MASHSNIFLPGEFHGQKSMVGYSLWSHKESNITEKVIHTQPSFILLRKASENLGVLSTHENRRKTFLGIVRLQTYLSFLVEKKKKGFALNEPEASIRVP